MRTFTQELYDHAREMEYLNKLGQARPAGKSTDDNLQMMVADPVGNVVKIGLMLKERIRK